MSTKSRTASGIDVQLGERVRARRLEIGMSQERLADLLGVTFQQVQKYEKGVNRIAASRLFDIAAALETPVCDFFEGLPGSFGKGGSGPRPAGSDELLQLFSTISSSRVRRRIVDLVRTMAADGS